MRRKSHKLFAIILPLAILLAYCFIGICFLNRWDAMVVVTLIPVWIWTGIGILISLLCWILSRDIFPGAVFLLCLLSLIAFSEETRGIGREVIASMRTESPQITPPRSPSLRIATVRCGGSEAVLRRAAESAPDVILVQGAPDKTTLDSVADQIYGNDRSVTSHASLAILARGSTLAVIADPSGKALHVRLRHPSGLILDISDLNFRGCGPRRDMWNPATWNDLTAARITGRRFLRTALGENPITRKDVVRIVGGYFGTPAGDDVYRPLVNNEMVDSFAASGYGWGDTAPPDYPLMRVDQIWISANMTPVKSTAILHPGAPSRMVLSEVLLPPVRVKRN